MKVPLLLNADHLGLYVPLLVWLNSNSLLHHVCNVNTTEASFRHSLLINFPVNTRVQRWSFGHHGMCRVWCVATCCRRDTEEGRLFLGHVEERQNFVPRQVHNGSVGHRSVDPFIVCLLCVNCDGFVHVLFETTEARMETAVKETWVVSFAHFDTDMEMLR